MTAPAPDLDAAGRFLALLDEEAPAFCFQLATDDPKVKATYPIGPDGKRKDPLARIINLPPDNLRALAVRHADGAAVWVQINEGDGSKRRRKENVRRIRAVFCDLDGSPPDPLLRCTLTPHIVIESSPGRYHAYWLCEHVALNQFSGLQKAIAARFGGDKAVHDLPRVMRLPGFWHWKGEPFLTRIVQINDSLPYRARCVAG